MKNKNLTNTKKLLVTKTQNCLLSVFLLMSIFIFHAEPTLSLDVDFFDTYTSTGNAFDKIVWNDTTCPAPTYKMTIGVLDPTFTDVHAYCVNMNRDDGGTYEACFFKNTTSKNNCTGQGLSLPAPNVTLSMTSNTWYLADEVTQLLDVTCGIGTGNTLADGTIEKNRGQIKYYCSSPSNATCHECGTTGNVADYDYYFIDAIFDLCLFDGDSKFQIRGRYLNPGQSILIEEWLCPSTKICDADHDADFIYDPTADYTSTGDPCRLKSGEACINSSECWNDAICGGNKTEYNGACDGIFVDIERDTWIDSCGGLGVQTEFDVLHQNNKNCTLDGGFPNNYVCDDTFEDINRATIPLVYNDICKGWIGVSCVVDSTCHNDLSCVNGFCNYEVFATYTENITDNSLFKGQDVSFDNTASFSSDDEIQFSCWNVGGSNVECDGNSTQCTSQCNGVSFDSSSWDDGFIHNFNSGGNFIVKLTIGSQGIYNDDYQESFCVSGDDNFCFSCFDNIKNDDETNIDWGGHCGFPYFIRCNNDILDNVTNETNIDYGGACGNCDNTNLQNDLDLQLLIESQLIQYPFDSSQCEDSEAISGGVVFFVFLISALLIIPIILFFVILLIISIFLGTGFFTLLFGIFRDENLRNTAFNKFKELLRIK